MHLFTIIIVAFGLAIDAFVVSVVTGSAYKQLHVKHALRMALFFGGFQAIMPIIGFMAGLCVKRHIEFCDHWIAFGLLTVVGGKMIYESFEIKSIEEKFDPSNIFVLLMLSVATSIDALAIGITLSFITSSVVVAVMIIGLVTFVLSYLGVYIGKKFGHFFENKIEAVGGIILIGIGMKILFEHLMS
ncbi:MAG: manganese efflux pump [Sedimentisphaerales bacterium]|nr:manganese efflux pump [Sedimentisphaerales bacterium]